MASPLDARGGQAPARFGYEPGAEEIHEHEAARSDAAQDSFCSFIRLAAM